MYNVGDLAVNSTVRVMWNSNAVAGESITRATNGSIRIYKNNSTTERTSAAGITDSEDFDLLTGIHHVNIDLSDNTDAGFYAAGNDYFVVLQGATIDGKAINAVLAQFSIENRSALRPTTAGRTLTIETDGMAHADVKEWLGVAPLALSSQQVQADMTAISGDAAAADNLEKEYDGTGYGQVLQRTTISTLASATVFTLTAGSADNDAYNDCIIVIEDATTAAQKAVAVIDDYVGASKTVTLRTDPAVFSIAATDIVTIIADRALKPTVMNRTLDVSAGGEAGIDWANVGTQGTAVNLAATTVNLVNTLTTYTGNTVQTGDAFARLGAPAGASVSADIAVVQSDTDNIQTRLPVALVGGRMDASVGAMATGVITSGAFAAGAIDAAAMNVTGSEFTAIPWNAAWDAEVESEVNDALVVQRLDELLNADSDIDGLAPPTVGSVFHELLTKTAGSFTFDQTTDSLEALRDRGDAAWISATGFALASVCTEARLAELDAVNIPADVDTLKTRIPGIVQPQTGDSFARLGVAGAGLTDLGGFSTTAKAQIQTEAEDALQSHHVVLVKTTIATLASQTSFTLTAGSADNDAYNGCEIVVEDAATAAQKAVGVVSDYVGVTKTVTLKDDPAVFTMAVSDVVTIRPSRSLKPTIDNRTLDVSAGGEAGIDWANVGTPGSTVGLSATTVGIVTTVGSVSGSVGSLAAQAKLDVNAEVVDVIRTDTTAELSSVPAASPALHTMVQVLYMSVRNKLDVTSTAKEIHKDDGTVLGTKTLSDSGVEYSEAKMA